MLLHNVPIRMTFSDFYIIHFENTQNTNYTTFAYHHLNLTFRPSNCKMKLKHKCDMMGGKYIK